MAKSFLLIVLSAFLFSCANAERDHPYDPGGINYIGKISSSGNGASSSSSVEFAPSSSSSNIAVNNFTDSRDGKKYRYVVIGSQTWMAQNLNYAVEGNKCYDNLDSNCDKYGRLYDWETARTVCPEDWHLPSNEEWTVLENCVGGRNNAGTKLKATSGWSNNGTDEYGFSALPGGYGYLDGSFFDSGNNGIWWSTTESSASGTYYRIMYYSVSSVCRRDLNEPCLFSVRCVMD